MSIGREREMNVMTKQRLEVRPLTRHIGAEIRGLDLRQRPDDEIIRQIYQTWLEHLVLVFPDQDLSQDDMLQVTGYFGELGHLDRPAKYHPPGFSRMLPGIMLISNIRENGEPIGALPDGEMMFHHDMIHKEVPSKATLLYSVEIPSRGAIHCLPVGMPPMKHSIRRYVLAWKANVRCITTIMAQRSGEMTGVSKPSMNASIRCSGRMKKPAARRFTLTA